MQVYHRLHVVEEEEKRRKVEQEVEREDQGEETRTHMDGYGDDMKDSNLSQGACVCEDEDTTTYLRECARLSMDVVAGVRIVRSHAIMNDVIDVRIVECHASKHVVVLCHPLVHNFVFSTLCPNSHLVVML